jgi:hypothetical protein
MADNPSAAWPIADSALSQKILDTVQQASHYRQLKKGNSLHEVRTARCVSNMTPRCKRSDQDSESGYGRIGCPRCRHIPSRYLASPSSSGRRQERTLRLCPLESRPRTSMRCLPFGHRSQHHDQRVEQSYAIDQGIEVAHREVDDLDCERKSLEQRIATILVLLGMKELSRRHS